MRRHRPVREGARIYNLFPLLIGSFDRWTSHFQRVREMGFNSIFVNPFHLPGFSGSLYSIKDYYRIHPLFLAEGAGKSPMEQLKEMVRTAREMGLHLIMDLVINHTAIDSSLVQEHPDWYLRGSDGKVKNPAVWEGDKCVAVWGDLAEIDNEHSRDRRNLWDYWEKLALFYCNIGFDGFRCDAAYQVTDLLWRELISRVKENYPEVLFFAETLGCEIEDVVRLARAGFDYTFNSSKYWDFEEAWCLSQYAENGRWAPSVSFAESHDTERLAEELQGNLEGLKQRYLFSALFSTGVMMPIGFEFGFRKKLHVVQTRPSDWEETGINLSSFIREVNYIKKGHPLFNEDGPMEKVDCGNDRICCLKKSAFDGGACALIFLNTDPRAEQSGRIPSIRSIVPGESPMADLTPGGTGENISDDVTVHLPPFSYRVLATQ